MPSVRALPALGLLLAVGCSAGPPPSEGTPRAASAGLTPWRDAGAFGVMRIDHTATRLADGRVLVVGGGSATAELYDPATRTWSATGALPADRAYHGAALLPGGDVLVVGGRTSAGATAEAWRYSPVSGTFSATGAMAHVRTQHSTTALPDGRVLVVGGHDPAVVTDDTDVDEAELYDPTTGTFSGAGSLAHGRRLHQATLLADGDVLITAGYSAAAPTYVGDCERWSPASRTFRAAGNVGGRVEHSATLLADGSVLLVGGRLTLLVSFGDVQRYDPVANTWTVLPPLTVDKPGRTAHRGVLLPDDRLAVVGGEYLDQGFPPPGPLLGAALYTPSTGTWARSTADAAVFRQHATATLLESGNVLLAGFQDAEELCFGQGCPCGTATECLSGLCVDGVCCDAACAGACQACSAALKGGGADGECAPITAGLDPDAECAATDATTCGLDGACDGAGACRQHVAGTACGEPSCANPQQESRASQCDGAGLCVPQGVADCGAYQCLGDGCLASCVTVAECSAGYFCVGGQCRKRPNGATCAAAADCESGFCVDGSCCNAACDGQCEACGPAGECRPVTGAPPAGKAACTGDGVCAGRCDGNDPLACAFPGVEVSCGTGSTCAAGACTRTEALCSADGASSEPPTGPPVDCAPYRCEPSSGACATRCAETTDCAAGSVCSGGACVNGGGSAAAGDPGGCAVAPAPPGRAGAVSDVGTWLAALGVTLVVTRRRRRAA